MKYKVIFSDLDRTFLDSNSCVSSENKRVVENLIAKGIPFIPATGRAFGSLPKDLFGIEGLKYVITSNGVAINEIATGKPIIRTLLPKGFSGKLFDFIEKEGDIAVEVYYGGKAYCSEAFYDDPVKFGQERAEYVKATRTPVQNLREFALERDEELDGLTIISPYGRLEELLEKVKARFEDQVYITSADGVYIELSNLSCGKHNALKKMCERLGVDCREAIAFGDNDNDIEMLQAAGLGICMANGTESCKAAADRIGPAFDENGVAVVLKELFFS
ncbi:MAG: Cof-type HAD-IIB family hydrolase [Lachnospiraceae bacterium]|nr:Cof-type HAD-IIB family hydrolase [Lachnospiraceae bacterium]